MNMKKLMLIILYGFCCLDGFSQTTAIAEPAYKRIPTIPPFTLALVPDSVSFSKENLKKKRAVIVMIFSPDCDHCVHATEDLIKNINLFRKVDIVMVTSLSFASEQKFYTDLHIAAHKNIHVGFDRERFLSSFYEVRNFPSIYLYDKKGNFKEAFEGSVSFEKIAKSL